MKVVVDRKEMENGILTASKAVNPKSPLPILSHLLVTAEGESLRFSATDLEMVIECQVPAQVIEPGAFTAPANLLRDIVTQLPEATVQLALLGPQLELRTSASRFLVHNCLAAEEFPVLPQADGMPSLVLSQEMFRDMIRGVLFAVAPPEETRAILTGILTQVESGTATLVTTDGRRLARVRRQFTATGETGVFRAIIPARAMAELIRLLHESGTPLEITSGPGQVFFRFGSILLVARLLEEGKFPDCESIIPHKFARTVRVHREMFLGAVRRALIMAQEKDSPRLLKLDLDPTQMALRSNTPDLGQAEEHLPIQLDGEPMVIAFNGRYLLDALNNISGEEIDLFLNDPLSMGMMRPVGVEDYLSLIMPVRVKDPVPEPAGV